MQFPRQENRPSPQSRRWPAVLSLALLAVVSVVAGASAQLNAAQETGVDTQNTPSPRDTKAWAQVAGAEFGVDRFPAGSPTPVEVEFYSVAFEHSDHGFAAGSQCKETVAPGADVAEHLENCVREPVIYEYLKTPTDESWRPILAPEGDGYVGAVAFMRDGTALAVGGTGKYPNREPALSSADQDAQAQGQPGVEAGAGEGRAWIYQGGAWSELDESRMQEGMRGMTALAMSARPGDCVDERSACGLAGAYQQIWMWKDGRFVQGWGTAGNTGKPAPAPTGVVDDPASFRFRVRQIAFTPGTTPPRGTRAVAVTSGCCDSVAARNTPRILVFDGQKLWVREYRALWNQPHPPDDDVSARRDVPNSFYGLTVGGLDGKMSLLASHGGPYVEEPAGELSSRVAGNLRIPGPQDAAGYDVGGAIAGELQTAHLSTVRLMGVGGQPPLGDPVFPDWGVGVLNDTGQGIAYALNPDQQAPAQTPILTCPGGPLGFTGQNFDLGCRPYETGTYTDSRKSQHLFRLPSYGLHAFAFTDSTETVGWAVGERGALVRFGGVGTTASAASEPQLPRLGAGTRVRFAGSEVYDAFRPLPISGDVPHVPSLASRGSDRVERPQLVAAGAPNPSTPVDKEYPEEDVSSIAMSRDGSEGWAVGGGPRPFRTGFDGAPLAPTVYHYDGSRWSRCDIRGISGLLPADPACAGLAPLFTSSNNVLLRSVVRVPVENDGNPSNDDEFEVVAVGETYDPAGALPAAALLARYQGGRWFVDETSQDTPLPLGAPLSVAFTEPDDGWVSWTGFSGPTLWHWDGTEWRNCTTAAARQDMDSCGDRGKLLPFEAGDPNQASLTVAGERIYFAGARREAGQTAVVGQGVSTQPVILYKDPGGAWTAANGGYDPNCVPQPEGGCAANPEASSTTQGKVVSLAVAEGPGGYEGWAVGDFGADQVGREAHDQVGDTPGQPINRYPLLRLRGAAWAPHTEDDAASDYVLARDARPVVLDPTTGLAALYMAGNTARGPGVLLFEPDRGRWRVFETPFHMRATASGARSSDSGGFVRGVVPDGEGGAWLAAKQRHSTSGEREAVHFWHYTREVPRQVFEEAPHPVREVITGGAAGADGSFWVTTNSSFVYRYDRLTGWEKLRVPGWDPGRVVTRTSEARAVAVGPDGDGLVVGEKGRIAQVSSLGVQLDPAAGKRTGRDLRAVAVAPNGAAFAGGDASSLLYRPAGGEFERLDFGGPQSASITAISMPTPDRVWFTDTLGQVYAGTRGENGWSIAVENKPGGLLLSRDENGRLLKLRGIAIDEDGEGYAVGERGLILERRGDGGWQRIKTGFTDTLRSVALAPQGRDGGALVGGDMGLILTLEDGDFRVAREADLFDPLNFGNGSSLAANVLGVALVPGVEEGQVEAWAVQQVPASPNQYRAGPGAILHYSSDPDNPLLRPGGRVDPLPDTPDPRDGEISFAAFGRSDCHGNGPSCPEGHAGNFFNEVVSRRIASRVIDQSKEPGGPSFAVFTGDVSRAAGRGENSENPAVNKPLDKSWAHRRWKELVADRFADAELPLFGAVGFNDLDRTAVCISTNSCDVDSRAAGGAGSALGWRRAMAEMDAPWGATGKVPESERYDFKAVPSSGEEPIAGHARTHYALDVCDGDSCSARLIFLDNSMRTLASSEPNQNPVERDGGQARWLERMVSGTPEGADPIVVTNYPTYSYTAGDPTTWAGDAATLETDFMRLGVKMVVSGRLGWNGRFWVRSPGVHEPCPGGTYIHDDDPPAPGDPPCQESTGDATQQARRAADELAARLRGLGAPAPPGEEELPVAEDPTALQGLLPTVVASSAGGTFGPDGAGGGPASDGWWHGYSVVRMDASGDPRKTIVEQRPIFDWISITAPSHVLKPRQRMALRGEGREPVGMDVPARYNVIDSPAITHRYDLVLADEQNPSLPRKSADGGYIEVPQNVGWIDGQTGRVTAGSGRQERTYAVAILSVGDKTASWPVAFEPAKSFKSRVATAPSRSVLQTPARPVTPRPVAPPPVVLNSPPNPTPPPTPPGNIPSVTLPTLKLPAPPALPQVPGSPAGTPTPAPPPPATPPPPPGTGGALPLSLDAPVAPISVVTTVIPPSPPPVNPAPPGGSAARKEARQRQAATAKSEEGGGGEGAGESSGGDSGASEMTRRAQDRPAPSYGRSTRDDRRYSFTAMSHTEQPSAWSRGVLYGGMTFAAALVLALGWGIARPTPKRRHPPLPAPETVRGSGERRK